MDKQLIDNAHEIWAAAQLLPGEGIEDGAKRIAGILARIDAERGKEAACVVDFAKQGWRDFIESIRVFPDGTPLFLSPTIPEGMALVPIEPTDAVLKAESERQDGLSLTDATQRIAELKSESIEQCRIIGMSGEREARHLARIAELEKVAQAYEDQVAAHNKTLDELARKVELIDEQKGTIRALNMALGGDGSTSTENLIDANEFDAGDKGLIALCREHAALIEKCERALRLVQKYAPITLDCEAFHHPKSMQHDSESTCEPAARYYHALNEVGKIIAAIAAQKGGAA